MAKPHDITREQAARKKAQAVSFLNRIGEPEHAQEFADMTVDDYAAHKGLRLTNPNFRRRFIMPTEATTVTKADLQDQIDQAIDVLDDAYQPESTRESLAEAIGNALDILRGEDDEDEDDDDLDTDDDSGRD
jgi:hypothetical protein